jgi:hypothetical protein
MFQFLARKRRRLLKDHISKNDNEMIRRKINLRNAFPRLHLHSPSTKALIKHPPWGGGPPKQHTPPQLAAHPNSTTPACFASASPGRHHELRVPKPHNHGKNFSGVVLQRAATWRKRKSSSLELLGRCSETMPLRICVLRLGAFRPLDQSAWRPRPCSCNH